MSPRASKHKRTALLCEGPLYNFILSNIAGDAHHPKKFQRWVPLVGEISFGSFCAKKDVVYHLPTLCRLPELRATLFHPDSATKERTYMSGAVMAQRTHPQNNSDGRGESYRPRRR